MSFKPVDYLPYDFANRRHIGPSGPEMQQMLDVKDIKSLGKFDIVFLDPPYKDKKFLSIFDNLKKKNILKKEHLIILHREKKTTELPLKL